jgi:hypothetical protein
VRNEIVRAAGGIKRSVFEIHILGHGPSPLEKLLTFVCVAGRMSRLCTAENDDLINASR